CARREIYYANYGTMDYW
nr:immunoglobulin heavy chain junction region [Mus musculus]NSM04406.1 immunoglobulin heavy chain junction region [Mus musculus]NSM04499.1 immunoglobulin heavy chain junction region [Mus musculus]NSM04602.1 immunoglobulin heavy chain junction region [Mus musculus]NSM04797.1 immunoglobulin heavy chain junction region [Mus musculus]